MFPCRASFQLALTPPSLGSIVSQTDLRNGSYLFEVRAASLGQLTVQLTVRGEVVAAAAVVIDIVSPLCDSVSMVLDATATGCLCRVGFGANGTTEDGSLKCAPCSAGRFAATQSQSECAACPANTYSVGSAAACTGCPAEGVSCDGGILSYLNGYWLEDPSQV